MEAHWSCAGESGNGHAVQFRDDAGLPAAATVSAAAAVATGIVNIAVTSTAVPNALAFRATTFWFSDRPVTVGRGVRILLVTLVILDRPRHIVHQGPP
ncbi:hypothetical protein [Streptomyces sp. MUSC 14]|uniref:hypothetical protein n=1 Tax=Streptomyces sp. MUSC 14 TaxID=1354889 RepID=UPI0015A6DB73|nr:hypothetical protein [Streptomyces sp. MUSC 14]